MQTSRKVILAGASAAVLAGGWIAAPAPLTVDEALPAPEPSATDAPAATPPPEAAGDVFTGVEVSNLRGVFQVQISVADGLLTDVLVLQAGTDEQQSLSINANAVPAFEEAILEAQTWDVDMVSGASYSSEGITESARDAMAQAGLD